MFRCLECGLSSGRRRRYRRPTKMLPGNSVELSGQMTHLKYYLSPGRLSLLLWWKKVTLLTLLKLVSAGRIKYAAL